MSSSPCAPSCTSRTGVSPPARAYVVSTARRRSNSVARGGAGGTGADAAAATGADELVDFDVVAGRCDGAGRTEVDARGAAGRGVAAVDANGWVIGDINGLLELADHLDQLEHGPLDRGGIAGVGAQISIAPLVRRKQRRIAAQIKDQVAR